TPEPSQPAMQEGVIPKRVLVRFSVPALHTTCSNQTLTLNVGSWVVADTEKGQRVGKVVALEPSTGQREHPRPILRMATDADFSNVKKQEERRDETLRLAKEMVRLHKLPMKIVDLEVPLSGNVVTFYFNSEDRVDFRTLVKELAKRFHARIEMRQIGI